MIFSPAFSLHFGATISKDEKDSLQVHAAEGSYLFSVVPDDSVLVSSNVQLSMFSLFLLGACCLLYGLLAQLILSIKRKKIVIGVVLVLLFVALYQLHSSQLTFLGTLDLFQPQLYASAVFMPSLGNLFIAISLVAVFCFFRKGKVDQGDRISRV